MHSLSHPLTVRQLHSIAANISIESQIQARHELHTPRSCGLTCIAALQDCSRSVRQDPPSQLSSEGSQCPPACHNIQEVSETSPELVHETPAHLTRRHLDTAAHTEAAGNTMPTNHPPVLSGSTPSQPIFWAKSKRFDMISFTRGFLQLATNLARLNMCY